MIKVVNKYTYTAGENDFYIGRGSVLGNPYTHEPVDKTKALYQVETREEAIDKYREWIKAEVIKPNNDLNHELHRIQEAAEKGGVVQLVCYCKPQSCHGDVVKEIVDYRIKIKNQLADHRVTPVWINKLKANQVFVFESNLAGIHGKAAALMAKKNWGAVEGVGFGLKGQSFAIPTKDKRIRVLDLPTIEIYVEGFLIIARQRTDLNFLVTEIGTGEAGYKHEDIAPMFADAIKLKNVWLPQKFITIIKANANDK